ncbi:MAG: SynChlorMet cassette protein ScmC [Desulfobacteraceae bacterium]|nr:SynChlorMet cassette protein ScmC [Desulfobacteraceae bacterium]
MKEYQKGETYLFSDHETDLPISIKISESLIKFQKIISDLLNFKIGNTAVKPLLWISDNENEIQGYNLKRNPLIKNIFKFKYKKDLYFLKCPSVNNTQLLHSVIIQQIMHAISFVMLNEIIPKGGVPIHSLLLEYKGNGILLVGGSGAGKTTGFKRVQQPFRALSDDHAFITIKNDEYVVHPFITISECTENRLPQSRDINYYVPLKMICFLNKSDKDQIIPINQSKAAYDFYNTAILLIKMYYNDFDNNSELKNFRTMIFNNACDIIKKVPSYKLNASLDGQFWLKIQEVIEANAKSNQE